MHVSSFTKNSKFVGIHFPICSQLNRKCINQLQSLIKHYARYKFVLLHIMDRVLGTRSVVYREFYTYIYKISPCSPKCFIHQKNTHLHLYKCVHVYLYKCSVHVIDIMKTELAHWSHSYFKNLTLCEVTIAYYIPYTILYIHCMYPKCYNLYVNRCASLEKRKYDPKE